LRLIFDDIKHSWYFRIWAFLWLFSAIFTFAVLILLGQRSTQAQLEPTFRFWRENASTIYFPNFHVFLPRHRYQTDLACTHNGRPLTNQNCPARHNGRVIPRTECQSIVANMESAQNKWGDFSQRIIECSFETMNSTDRNHLVVFELEGSHIAHYGEEAFGGLEFSSNNNTWILLDKSDVSFDGRPTMEEWERELVYHSSVWNHDLYRFSVIINRFYVTHVIEGHKFDGWRAIGEIGGFAYFLLLLHALMMIIVGVCLNNDAKILVGESSGGGYASLGSGSSEERTGIL